MKSRTYGQVEFLQRRTGLEMKIDCIDSLPPTDKKLFFLSRRADAGRA